MDDVLVGSGAKLFSLPPPPAQVFVTTNLAFGNQALSKVQSSPNGLCLQFNSFLPHSCTSAVSMLLAQ